MSEGIPAGQQTLSATGFSPSALRAPLDGDDGDEMDELPNEFNEAYQGGAA